MVLEVTVTLRASGKAQATAQGLSDSDDAQKAQKKHAIQDATIREHRVILAPGVREGERIEACMQRHPASITKDEPPYVVIPLHPCGRHSFCAA